ncbi:hypothetical protein [Undibacterium sp. Di24W]|uniref:hypothetical protein n=1 Tax=Undibacterium sp. Di24W TaxID=3413033 RepID=UPI003BF1FBD3
MQLDQLQIDLRPRPNAQALDLGFALLRSNAAVVYITWLMLWLPTIFLCGLAAYFIPHLGFFGGAWWLVIAWWIRPLLERAPLYILSRRVFGESVSWQQALRAWPSQCGGGWFRLLVWWRLFSGGRGLYQPIWQLEGARGKVAANRIRIIGNKTIGSATWFGIACAHFEALLQLGLFACIGLFMSDDQMVNPLSFFTSSLTGPNSSLWLFLSFAAYAISAGVIGPVFVACSFTLYLNRRACIEAWDIEIMLRQIEAPQLERKSSHIKELAGILILCFSNLLLPPKDVYAADQATISKPNSAEKCEKPKWLKASSGERGEPQSKQQQEIRNDIDTIYQAEELRPYLCQEIWKRPDKTAPKRDKFDLSLLAIVLKYIAIIAGLFFVGWLLFRYRTQIFGFTLPERKRFATEVGGLDIRPESLPDDISSSALNLWKNGQQRAAIALLYRATLSRLVNEHGMLISQGATENDCLRLAKIAHSLHELDLPRLRITETCTAIWLSAAYAHRFPDNIALLCQDWNQEFAANKTNFSKHTTPNQAAKNGVSI